MDKWQRIELLVNRLLESITNVIKGLYQKSAPTKFTNFVNKSSQSASNKKKQIVNKTKDSYTKSISFILLLKTKLAGAIDKIKQLLLTLIVKIKSFNFKELGPKKSVLLVFSFLTPILLKAKNWYLSLKPTTVMGVVVISSISSLTAFNVYTQSKKIAEKAAQSAAREPASHVENATTGSKRPGYYKVFEKEFLLRNVKLPVHFESKSKNSMRTLSMDFTLVASNRYIKEYFFENIHLVKDRLNIMVHPIIPQFPLEDEGKKIIKEKIKVELNKLLKDLKIKGEIDTVHIHSILAG